MQINLLLVYIRELKRKTWMAKMSQARWAGRISNNPTNYVGWNIFQPNLS